MKNKFKDKKVLILGLGLNEGGVGSARFFAQQGAIVKVTDIKTGPELMPSLKKLEGFNNIEYVLGEHRYEDIDWAEIIIRNPALKPGNPYREYAQNSGKKVELDMGIFLDFVDPQNLICITGTKGKSTTSSLIYEIFKNSGKKVVFGGNIGKSVLDILSYIDSKTLIVLEVSSFQLEAFDTHQTSPHIAVITNIFEDHLDYYPTFEHYIQSKKVIAKYQTKKDYLFLKDGDQVTQKPSFQKGLASKIIKFSPANLPQGFKPKLQGEHNKFNMAAALAVSKTFNIKEGQALLALENFLGVPFRFELIYNKGGIKIYNDTTATNPAAAIHSLKSLPSCLLICGGQNANMDYQNFADTIDKFAKAVYFLDGDATEEIKKYIMHRNILRSTYKDLASLLKDLKLEIKPGDKVLFSPGAKSFNLFANEFDRGKKFNEAVEKIFKS